MPAALHVVRTRASQTAAPAREAEILDRTAADAGRTAAASLGMSMRSGSRPIY